MSPSLDMHGGLVRLNPSYPLSYFPCAYRSYHRILPEGWQLLYLSSLLDGREPRQFPAVLEAFSDDLEHIIRAVSTDSPPSELDRIDWTIFETARNYAESHRLPSSPADIRSRFQRYKLVFGNVLAGCRLTQEEEGTKNELKALLGFFIKLEEQRQEYKRYVDSLTDE